MLPTIFSLLFLAAFSVYLYFTIYIIYKVNKKREYYVFIGACICLAIWSFSYSIANSAPDLYTVFFWRRVSCIGWALIHGFLLNFIIVLCGHTHRIKNKLLFLLLYLPGILTIYVFAFNKDLAAGHLYLINTKTGWINIAAGNGWDVFFHIYYVAYAFAEVALLWQWGRKSSEQKIKRQAVILIGASITAAVLNSMTEVIINVYTSYRIPQAAPMIDLVPVACIYYCIVKYDMMSPLPENQNSRATILDSAGKEKMYQLLMHSFVGGSILNIAAMYFILKDTLQSTLIFSLELAIIGMSVIAIKNMNFSDRQKELLLILVASLSIPFITLRFLEYGSISVWAFPYCFIILFTIFDRRKLILPLAISTILTQLWVFIKVPEIHVRVDASDHIIRIGLLMMGIYLSVYINRVYANRLREIEKHSTAQELISKVSTDFININSNNCGLKISKMMESCRSYFHLHRIKLILLEGEHRDKSCFDNWNSNDIITVDYNTCFLMNNEFFRNKMIHGEEVYIPNVDELPAEAHLLKDFMELDKIKSFTAIPLIKKEMIRGFLIFGSVESNITLNKENNNIIQILSNILSDALVKIDDEMEISHMAYHDTLTNLPNRALFRNYLNQAIKLAKSEEKLVGLMFIDLDSFKAVNDSIGHFAGDVLLQEISFNLASCLDSDDLICRFGGDEFLIMIANVESVDEILKKADIVFNAVEQPVQVGEQEITITVSAGISVYPFDGDNPDALIKNADLSMYKAKGLGRNRYTVCSEMIKQEEERKMLLISCLSRALEKGEMELFYQPQMSSVTHQIIGLEALIRWNQEDYGLIMPADFIPIAEQAGLIYSIGEWVLKTACRQSMAWQGKGIKPIPVAVNLSLEQLYNENLVGMISETLKKTGLQPELLEIEITESLAMKQGDQIIQTLHEMKDLGVSISLDDFGIDYSSLNRINQLPIDCIKIAMHFVQGISQNNTDEAIIRTVISLAKSLGVKVIAEGVETEKQVAFLSENLCDSMQGFYFYKPMRASEIEQILLQL